MENEDTQTWSAALHPRAKKKVIFESKSKVFSLILWNNVGSAKMKNFILSWNQLKVVSGEDFSIQKFLKVGRCVLILKQ